jgi:hypothetical protein
MTGNLMPTLIQHPPHHADTSTELELSSNSGRAKLLDWHREGCELAFVYSRSMGGLMQTGRCRIVRLSQELATLDAVGCKLVITLSGAHYETGPQQFFTPNLLTAFNVDGVSVRLANHDWLFLSEEAVPTNSMQLNEG